LHNALKDNDAQTKTNEKMHALSTIERTTVLLNMETKIIR